MVPRHAPQGLIGAVRRFLAFRQLVTAGPVFRPVERNPASDRWRQTRAARAAFLGDLSPNQRALAQRPYGDQL